MYQTWLMPDEMDMSDQNMIGVAYFMEPDEMLEMEYEDRYTIQGDITSEDISYWESDEDDEDLPWGESDGSFLNRLIDLD